MPNSGLSGRWACCVCLLGELLREEVSSCHPWRDRGVVIYPQPGLLPHKDVPMPRRQAEIVPYNLLHFPHPWGSDA